MAKKTNWETNIDRLLSHLSYKKISKLVSSDRSWVRVNYKDKEVFIQPYYSWTGIEIICDTMLK